MYLEEVLVIIFIQQFARPGPIHQRLKRTICIVTKSRSAISNQQPMHYDSDFNAESVTSGLR